MHLYLVQICPEGPINGLLAESCPALVCDWLNGRSLLMNNAGEAGHSGVLNMQAPPLSIISMQVHLVPLVLLLECAYFP